MLIINDFSPFVDMTEGEFFDYFKDKCNQGTPIRKIYRDEKKKNERFNNLEVDKDVRVNKANNSKRKKAKPDSTTD